MQEKLQRAWRESLPARGGCWAGAAVGIAAASSRDAAGGDDNSFDDFVRQAAGQSDAGGQSGPRVRPDAGTD